MISPDRLRRPFGTLLASELRVVGLALSREAALAAAGLALLCILVAATAIRYGERLDAMPELLLAVMPVAAILPWLVWKGDPPFGRAFLWTLPVRRQQAALARTIAGAVWLIVAVTAALVGLLAMAAATGGSIGIEEERLVGPYAAGVRGASRVAWVTPLWMWLTPFGGALVVYAGSTAILLGLRHPLRWLAGLSVAVVLLVTLGVNLGPRSSLQHGVNYVTESLILGTYGLDFAVTGGALTLVDDVPRPGPGSDLLWEALPRTERWVSALFVWLGGALIALGLAIRRHWER